MRRLFSALAFAAAASALAAGMLVRAAPPPGQPIYLDQGPQWTATQRQAFYAMDQGSEVMPLAWARALTAPDGAPFLADRLARYGYLDGGTGGELPVGFTAATRAGTTYLGMTCAACHTRQITVDGVAYRIDGGPALSNFHQFLQDLDGAVGAVVASDAAFAPFADRVLGPAAGAGERAALRQQLEAWYHRQHALFARALPPGGWGVGRLDAVSMILNRVAGLDIGPAADWLIEGNIHPADAPVRYPFIWDAPRQDRTQWPGFAENGDVVLAIARNLGEVYGVFADFHPVKDRSPDGYDYLTRNSANFDGLDRLEGLVRRIGAPAWPWPTDAGRVARGGVLFAQNCQSCHGIRPGALRLLPLTTTWKTETFDVGTDTREYDVLARTGDTGVLKGAPYGLTKRLQAQDRQFNILAAAVIGTMADRFVRHGLPVDSLVQPIRFGRPLPTVATARRELTGAYQTDAVAQEVASGTHRYEARVLRGIWATAPYLHNGAVGSLAELLKRPEERAPSFAVGPAYDRDTVGLAAVQPGAAEVRRTTGCEDVHSGNSRCGHLYGTDLTAAQKRDLLEYLKSL